MGSLYRSYGHRARSTVSVCLVSLSRGVGGGRRLDRRVKRSSRPTVRVV